MSDTGDQLEHVTVDAGGTEVDVAAHVAGEGPPLVCVHGIGLDAALVGWRDAHAALADDRTVYAVDLPNHGASEATSAVRTTEDYVDVFGAVVDALDLDSPAIAGLSMGGAVALGHALDGGDPDRLVLVDSYGLGGDAPWRTAAGFAVRMPFADGVLAQSLSTRAGVRSTISQLVGNGVPEALVDDVLASVNSTSLRAMRRWQRHEFRHDGLRTDYRDQLADLSVPTLLIHGEHDPLLPLSWSLDAHDRIPDSDLLRLPGVGHWPPREQTERVFEAIDAFVSA